MKALLVFGIWFGVALCLYLLIIWIKKAAEQHNQKTFKKDRTSLTYKLGGGIK
jgi:hypothetical protein